MGWLRRLFGGSNNQSRVVAPAPTRSRAAKLGPATGPPARAARNRGRKPARPAGQRFECWGSTPVRVEVAGESYVEDSFRAIFEGNREFRDQQGCEIRDDAVLVPDPRNPYDRNAIAVYVRDQHVGYIPRDIAQVWHSTLADLAEQERVMHAQARTWARTEGTRVYARVTFRLPKMFEHLHAATGFPPGSLWALPRGNRCQVTKEEPHQEHLRALLDRHGRDACYAAVMQLTEREMKSGMKQIVEVAIDGRPVGELTATTSAKYVPTLEQARARGLTVVVRAQLDDTKGKVDVSVDAQPSPATAAYHQDKDSEL